MKKLITFTNQKVSIELSLDFEDILLENIYMTYKGKNSKDAIGSTNGIFSKGIVDNDSGVAIVLELLQKTIENNSNSNMDIIFSFVNSEEQMYLNIPGSKFFNQFLKEDYNNILNINLDSLGEKNVDTIYYGMSGDINKDSLIEHIQNSFNNMFILENVDYYPSDNVNFDNSVFFYNFNWSNNNILHTEKDNIESIDIDKLENISEGLMQFLLSLSKMEMKDILRIDNTVSNCIVKEKDYISDLNFGQYVFYECGDEPNKIHFFIQDRYQEMVKDLEDISKDLSKNLFDKDSIYNVTFNFELAGIEYKDQMLEQIYNYFNEVPDLKFLISEYTISLFRLSNLDENTYEAKYTFSAQRYPLEYIALIEYFQQDFAKMKDLTVGQDNKTDIYIGYENNIKVMKSIFEDSEYFYLLNFFIYGDDLLSLPLDDLNKIFKDGTKDVLSMIK